MNLEEPLTRDDAHKRMAIELFNRVWELMDKKDRTEVENEEMIHAAHASRFHWGEVGTPLEFERGDWQISRVYSVLGMPGPALHYAELCLRICKENEIGDFDIAFAYEAMARAHATAGDTSEAEQYIQLAKEAGKRIKEEGNKDYFFSDLKTVPGYQE